MMSNEVMYAEGGGTFVDDGKILISAKTSLQVARNVTAVPDILISLLHDGLSHQFLKAEVHLLHSS